MYQLIVRVEKDGREVGVGASELNEQDYADERQALEALHQKADNARNEAMSGAYEAAGIEQFPQGGGEDIGVRE